MSDNNIQENNEVLEKEILSEDIKDKDTKDKEKKGKKKSKKKIAIIGIIVLVLIAVASILVLGYIGIISLPFMNNQEYTKGKVVDNVYKNEWSKLMLKLPSGYENAMEERYAAYTGEGKECGLYAIDKKNNSITVVYIDTSKIKSKKTVKEFLDAYATDNIETSGLLIKKKLNSGTKKIVKKEYEYVNYQCVVNLRPVVQNYYSRKIGKYYEIIIITGIEGNVNDNEKIVEKFQKYK